jgi:mRNA deadenylase 3'-5' endonuclease subunit Ccr4
MAEIVSATAGFPVRVSVMTYNVWGNMHWPQRKESLAQTLLATRPDILMLQGMCYVLNTHV